MPTYNGERFIREALDSLLAQDYPNFEILISDNASTDATASIVDAYASRDSRIRVVHQALNLGAPANFNFVFRETIGPFFMWAGDDDRWDPRYVSACVGALRANPRAVLACTRIEFISEAGGKHVPDGRHHDNPELGAGSVCRRVRTLMASGAWYQVYGLMRRDQLAATRLFGTDYGADVVLSVEIAILGSFVRVPEALFQYRLHEVRADPDRGGWHKSIRDVDRVRRAPYTYLHEAIGRAICRSPAPVSARTGAMAGLILAAYIDKTPIRGWIGSELGTRLRMALAERDIGAILKYGPLFAARRARRAFHREG